MISGGGRLADRVVIVTGASRGLGKSIAVRLAVVSPEVMTGCLMYDDDVLHPELGRRGWLGERPDPP